MAKSAKNTSPTHYVAPEVFWITFSVRPVLPTISKLSSYVLNWFVYMCIILNWLVYIELNSSLPNLFLWSLWTSSVEHFFSCPWIIIDASLLLFLGRYVSCLNTPLHNKDFQFIRSRTSEMKLSSHYWSLQSNEVIYMYLKPSSAETLR